MNIELGQVVCSKAGRDKGRKFFIVGIIDESYVLIADGDLRKIEKPKKKKIKHLELTGEVNAEISRRLKSGPKLLNAEIRKILEVLERKKIDCGL